MADFKMIEHLLDRPEKPFDKGIILIPGIGNNALSDKKYDLLSGEITKAGFCFLRFDLWTSEKELDDMSLNEIFSVLDQAVHNLESMGCKKIGIVGKSFGGAVSLIYRNQKINSMVAWSPAIGLAKQSNFTKARNLKLSSLKSLDDMKINVKELKKIKSSVLIIQGTKDKVVSKEQSAKLSEIIPGCSIEYIDGASHSFEEYDHTEQLIGKTVAFLKKTM